MSSWTGDDAFFCINIVSRALTGIASAFLFTVSNSSLVNTVIASDYPTRVFSLIGINESCVGLGMMTGPLVGTVLYEFLGFQGVFFGLATLLAVTGLCVYMMLGADRGYVYAKVESGLLTLVGKPTIIVTLFPIAFSSVTASASNVFMAPHLQNYGLSTLWIGVLFGVWGTCFLLSSFTVSRTLHRANKRLVNSLGCCMGMVGMSLMGPWPEVIPKSLGAVIIGFVMVPIALSMLFVEALPSLIEVATVDLELESDDKLLDRLSGTVYSGLLNMGVSIGEIVGPSFAGSLIPVVGIDGCCGAIAGIGALAAVVYASVFCAFARRNRTLQPMGHIPLAHSPIAH